MKLFKVYVSIFVIVGLFFGLSVFFPHVYKFERSAEINKPIHDVFIFMNDLRNWEKWSPWNKSLDNSLFTFYGNRSDSLGGRQYFVGNTMGKGRFLITHWKKNTCISYNLHMDNGDVNANGTFYFISHGQSTILNWVDSGDVGLNPLFRYMIPSKRSSTEAAFEEGLKRIKVSMEKP